jgi:hypothetical protein
MIRERAGGTGTFPILGEARGHRERLHDWVAEKGNVEAAADPPS